MAKLSKKEYALQKKEEIRKDLDKLSEKLMDPEAVYDFIHKRCFVLPDDVPVKSWSFLNQMKVLMFTPSLDARGFRQWEAVGRNVKKGCKASTYILVPCFKKELNKETGKEEQVLAYFKKTAVFSVEDTEGEELEYIKELENNKIDLSRLPMAEIAKSLNIELTTGLSFSPKYYGRYSVNRLNGDKKIFLCTDSEQTFFHEMAHAIDHQIGNMNFKKEQSELDEVVAEFTACFLAGYYGRTQNMNYTKEYIKHHSENTGKHSAEMLAKAIGRAVEIVDYIINYEAENNSIAL